MGYADWLKKLAPPSMQGANGQALLGELGAEVDRLGERAREGVRARFPDGAPADALLAVGDDRRLPRGPAETDAQYATRLKAAWATWELAGSHTAVLRYLKIMGYPAAKIIQTNGRRTELDGSDNLVVTNGVAWGFDATAFEDFTPFGVFFYTAMPAVVAGSAETAAICRIVYSWKNAKSRFLGIWIITGTSYWGAPARTWGGVGITWAGNSARAVPAIPKVDIP